MGFCPLWPSIVSLRFRRVRHRRVRRNNNFCLSRQNRLSYILDIWDTEYIGLGQCSEWPFFDLTQGHGCGID